MNKLQRVQLCVLSLAIGNGFLTNVNANGGTLNWTPGGSTPNSPITATGVWNTTVSNWTGATPSAWVNGSAANFPYLFPPTPSTAAIVTINDPSGTVQVSGLTFPATPNFDQQSAPYTIAAAPGDTLTLLTPSITAGGGGSGTDIISAPITGSVGVTFLNSTGSSSGTVELAGQNTYTGPTQGRFILGNGASLPNTAITGTPTFLGSSSAGTTGPGVSGATLNVSIALSMSDGTIGTFDLNQQAGFTGTALTLNSAGLNFDLGQASADEFVVNGPGVSSLSGTQLISINTAGDAFLTPGSYTILSDAAGGLDGNFAFFKQVGDSTGTPSEEVDFGSGETGRGYTLTLQDSPTSVQLLVSQPVQLPEPGSLLVAAAVATLSLSPRRNHRH